MLDYCIYLLYRGASALVSLLPLRILHSLGKFLGLLAWALSAKYRRLAHHNLGLAFAGEKSGRELRALTRRHFQQLGSNFLRSIKVGRLSSERAADHVVLENAEALDQPLRAGRPVVLTLSHIGCWELFTAIIPRRFGYAPISTVYQPLSNRFIDADVRSARGRDGLVLFDRRAGFHEPIAFLRKGGLVGILSDQHAGDTGLWTPFFGRLASTTPLPGLLAKRTHAAVVSAAIFESGPGKWRMVFTSRYDAPEDSVESLTAKTNAVLEEQIRAAPADWFWVHNRWKTPKPNFLLAHYKRGVHLPSTLLPNELKSFRILIRASNWLGDSVISSAAVRAIKRGRPDAHVTIAAPAKLAPVWKLIPEVDEILPLPSPSLFAAVRLLKKQKAFDVAILFPNSLRSALEVWLAGIPRRVGFRGHERAWLLNQIVPEPNALGPIQHQVHRYLHLAKEVGARLEAAPLPKSAPNESSIVGLCAGAEYGPAKRWLPERFAEVANAVAAQRPVHWKLFGVAADTEIGRTISGALTANCTNRIGETTLDQLIAELRECRLLLTNDTGTMHLAALLGVPVVAIFGSTEDRLTGPLGPGHLVVRHHVECSPCFLRECPIDFRCMKSVTTDEVTAAVLRLL